MTYKVANVGDLVQGVNVGAILTCKIVMHLDRPQEVPMSCLVVDSKNVYSVISLYGTNSTLKDKLIAGDLCYVKNPQLIFTSIMFQGRLYSYQCVKVSEITDVLINDG